VSTPSAATTLAAAAAQRSVRLACHLKIDTGMNRLGFRHDQLDRTMPAIAASPHLDVVGVFTHFATADVPDDPLFGEQRLRFEQARRTLARLAIRPQVTHMANSAAMLRDERVWFDFVRPGLLLYGIVPPPLAATLRLRPALSLHSRIVAVKGVRRGEATGYGLKDPIDHPATLGVVPAGYADGLDLRLAGRGFMLVRGRRAPIVGSVCMDMAMIDVTGTDVAPGDEVVIVGDQGDEAIGMREIAAAIGTIPYELLCRLGSRIQRVFD
jgi:alanine racemase